MTKLEKDMLLYAERLVRLALFKELEGPPSCVSVELRLLSESEEELKLWLWEWQCVEKLIKRQARFPRYEAVKEFRRRRRLV